MEYIYGGKFYPTDDIMNWYVFKDHRWITNNDVYMCVYDIGKYYEKIKNYYEGSKAHKKIVETCQLMISKLDTPQFKIDVLRELKEIALKMYPGFMDKLDKNIFLTGFKNGVFDSEKSIFRDGIPEDYITMTTGINYIEEHGKYKDALMTFLDDIFPVKAVKEYMLDVLCTGLCGVNRDELFHIWSGIGRNGKSKFASLIQGTFGDYATVAAVQCLYEDPANSSNPRPDLIDWKNRRFLIVSEPKDKHKLNSSFIKGLTGNDDIKTRNLYDRKMIIFKPTFRLIMLCNTIPTFDVNDASIWMRAICAEFVSEFVENVDPTQPKQKKIDTTIQEKLPNFYEEFMLLLVKRYNNNKTNKKLKIQPPQEVLNFTNETKTENDEVRRFFKERVDPTGKEEDKIHLCDLYDDFKDWFRSANPYVTPPNNRAFNKSVNLMCYESKQIKINKKNKNGLCGVKMIVLTEENPSTNKNVPNDIKPTEHTDEQPSNS